MTGLFSFRGYNNPIKESHTTAASSIWACKDENGNVRYLIGLLKAIRKQLQKSDGDSVHVVIRERE